MSLPSATTRLVSESSGLATGTDLQVIWAPVSKAADNTPRLYSSSQAAYDAHGYAQGIDHAALHVQETGLPFMLVPLPIDSAGAVGRFDTSGRVTGTSVVSVAVGANGSLDECHGILEVVIGGTVGTDQITLSLSMDGGRHYQTVKLGTASSYTIPYFGQVLSFAGGTLVAGEVPLTWHSTAPKAGTSDIAAARTKLLAQTKLGRSWILHGDVSLASDVTAVKSAVDTYETAGERYTIVKVSCRDRLPSAEMSQTQVVMTGSPSLSFAEVGDTGDTITRSAGSFVTDGFVNGMRVTVTGSVSNNITDAKVTNVAADVLTLDDTDLADEGPKAGCTLVGVPSIIFAEVGGTGDTITRLTGSWLDDGFRVGDILTVADTLSNDGTTAVIDTVTATVITLTTFGLVAEEIGSDLISITAGETDAEAVATLDAAMETVIGDGRVDIGYGRGAMLSPITGYALRRPVQWADSLLAFQRDINQTTWHKDKGPISSRLGCGFDLNDVDGQPYEHDERTDGGCLAAGFTCARTWGNGPPGAFIAQSRTRMAIEGNPLCHTSNMYVANLAQTVCQQTTENFAGATLELNAADGTGKRTATSASLKLFEAKVNAELSRYLLGNLGGEGPRASVAHWTCATDDDLGMDDATLHGTLDLQLNGILVHIATSVRVK